MADVLIARVSYDVLITRVLITRVDCMCYKSWWIQNAMGYYRLWVITVWVISGLTVMGFN